MANRYAVNLIKARRSYSVKGICSLLSIDRRTCFRWINHDGLAVMEPGARPILVTGVELKKFILKQRMSRQVPLREDQFYCVKCRIAVMAKKGSEGVAKTGKILVKSGIEQRKKTGLCEHCDTPVNRYIRLSQED